MADSTVKHSGNRGATIYDLILKTVNTLLLLGLLIIFAMILVQLQNIAANASDSSAPIVSDLRELISAFSNLNTQITRMNGNSFYWNVKVQQS